MDIHIALLPDKSGFITGAREWDVSRFYKHIAPLERKLVSEVDGTEIAVLYELRRSSEAVCDFVDCRSDVADVVFAHVFVDATDGDRS